MMKFTAALTHQEKRKFCDNLKNVQNRQTKLKRKDALLNSKHLTHTVWTHFPNRPCLQCKLRTFSKVGQLHNPRSKSIAVFMLNERIFYIALAPKCWQNCYQMFISLLVTMTVVTLIQCLQLTSTAFSPTYITLTDNSYQLNGNKLSHKYKIF